MYRASVVQSGSALALRKDLGLHTNVGAVSSSPSDAEFLSSRICLWPWVSPGPVPFLPNTMLAEVVK